MTLFSFLWLFIGSFLVKQITAHMQINILQCCNIFGGSQLALITQWMEANMCHEWSQE